MSVKDDCPGCTDESLCRKHVLIGIAAASIKSTPQVPYHE